MYQMTRIKYLKNQNEHQQSNEIIKTHNTLSAYTLMNSWSKTASASKSGARFPTNGSSLCNQDQKPSEKKQS